MPPYGASLLTNQPKVATFSDRWPQLAWSDPTSLLAQLQLLVPKAPGAAIADEIAGASTSLSYAPEVRQVPWLPAGTSRPN
jgi:hypothetical protein